MDKTTTDVKETTRASRETDTREKNLGVDLGLHHPHWMHPQPLKAIDIDG